MLVGTKHRPPPWLSSKTVTVENANWREENIEDSQKSFAETQRLNLANKKLINTDVKKVRRKLEED